MIEYNQNYDKLSKEYLFVEMNRRIADYRRSHADCKIISLGIGDVSLPLPKIITESLVNAATEMGEKATFRGYCPERGYDFLLDAVCGFYFMELGVEIDQSNVFISDGAKTDAAAITDVFGNVKVLVPNPSYPVYRDAAVTAGKEVVLLPQSEQTDFIPSPDAVKKQPYLIYLCSPDNPTGVPIPSHVLKRWVDFANESGSVIVFDVAYERFINGTYPRSIFQIDGAQSCAVEIGSLSKSAGFTGMRCSYLVCGSKLKKFSELWLRRQSGKFNGTPYVIQRAAEAAFSERGVLQCKELIEYYRKNAETLVDALRAVGAKFYGGEHSPYIWLKCPCDMTSFEFFDFLLDKAQTAATPGKGFGSGGEGFVRLSALGDAQSTEEAANRIKNAFSFL